MSILGYLGCDSSTLVYVPPSHAYLIMFNSCASSSTWIFYCKNLFFQDANVYFFWFAGDSKLENPSSKQQSKLHVAPPHNHPHVAACEVDVPGMWLTDIHVDHAQQLLGSRFPSLSGFQSTTTLEKANCNQVVAPSGEWIQIIHVNNNHWLTVSNIGCNLGTVNVYDSMS